MDKMKGEPLVDKIMLSVKDYADSNREVSDYNRCYGEIWTLIREHDIQTALESKAVVT